MEFAIEVAASSPSVALSSFPAPFVSFGERRRWSRTGESRSTSSETPSTRRRTPFCPKRSCGGRRSSLELPCSSCLFRPTFLLFLIVLTTCRHMVTFTSGHVQKELMLQGYMAEQLRDAGSTPLSSSVITKSPLEGASSSSCKFKLHVSCTLFDELTSKNSQQCRIPFPLVFLLSFL